MYDQLFSTVSGLREMFNVGQPQEKTEDAETYDPRKRDPQYAHASASPMYELVSISYVTEYVRLLMLETVALGSPLPSVSVASRPPAAVFRSDHSLRRSFLEHTVPFPGPFHL